MLWYAKSSRGSKQPKFRRLFARREIDSETLSEFRYVELPGGTTFPTGDARAPDGTEVDYRLAPKRLFKDYPKARLFRPNPITSGGTFRTQTVPYSHDGKLYHPGRKVFFPMSGEKDGWSRVAKNLKAEIDESLIESYRGTVSLPFEAGEHGRVAVKIVDDRGIESLKIVDLS